MMKQPSISLLLASIISISVTHSTLAQEEKFGMQDYARNCLNCHGAQFDGNGPMAQLFIGKPTDLRFLARDNEGVFPFEKVYQAIDGRSDIRGHGSSAMPVWGNYFRKEAVCGGLPVDMTAEQIVQGRILSLVYYLQGIQKP